MMNFIRNGDFTVAQRGLTFSNVQAGFTLDRWFVTHQGAPSNVIAQDAGLFGFPNSIRVQRPQGSTASGAIAVYQAIPSDLSAMLANGSVTLSFLACKGADWSGSALWAAIITGRGLDEPSGPLGDWIEQQTAANEAFNVGAPSNFSLNAVLPPGPPLQAAIYFYWWPQGIAGADDFIKIGGVRFGPNNALCTFIDPIVEAAACRAYFERLNDPDWPSDVGTVHVNSATMGKATLHFTAKRHRDYAVRLGPASGYHISDNDGNPVYLSSIAADGHKMPKSCRLVLGWPAANIDRFSRLICDDGGSSIDIDADL